PVHILLFFFTDPPPTEIYTLSLHDALPILVSRCSGRPSWPSRKSTPAVGSVDASWPCGSWTTAAALRSRFASPSSAWTTRRSSRDRKSTRLNSSHDQISYAVFCLKKKKHKA